MNDLQNFEITDTVPFHDLDPMKVVWHGNYLKYFDRARAALFLDIGIDLYDFYKRTDYLFPVSKTSMKYVFPLQYRDEFICKATLVEAKIKIVVDFEIRLASNGKVCTKGRGEQVAVKSPEMELMLKIPDEIRTALGF
ncbi:MAG: acyl-CoA thioesterase [bacterium]|nr:acyl-CoA thioesterase [bacterium]